MPGKADIITYVILGAFVLAIIVWAMMNTGIKVLVRELRSTPSIFSYTRQS